MCIQTQGLKGFIGSLFNASSKVEKVFRAQKYPTCKLSSTNANVAGLLMDLQGLSVCLHQLPFCSHIRTTSAERDIVSARRDKKLAFSLVLITMYCFIPYNQTLDLALLTKMMNLTCLPSQEKAHLMRVEKGEFNTRESLILFDKGVILTRTLARQDYFGLKNVCAQCSKTERIALVDKTVEFRLLTVSSLKGVLCQTDHVTILNSHQGWKVEGIPVDSTK